MTFSFNPFVLEKKLNAKMISACVFGGFFLILISKFYYLWGTSDGVRPGAHPALVLVRDCIIFSFLGFFGFLGRRFIFKVRFFWFLWFVGGLISLLHLGFEKDLGTWAQHYVRNTLIPLLFYPVTYGILSLNVKIPLRKIFAAFFILNLAVSYFQLFFYEFRIRPTGLFGDPIINTMILFWGWVALHSYKKYLLSLVSGVLLAVLLQYLSSLTAILSFFLALGAVLFLSRRAWVPLVVKNSKWIFVFTIALSGAIMVVGWKMDRNPDKRFEGLTKKMVYLYDAWKCKGDGCYRYWSYEGRVASNLRPLQLCEQSFSSCLLGNLPNSQFERMESTFGSLVTNWGSLFCLLFIGWLIFHMPYPALLQADWSEAGKDTQLWILLFYSGCAFAAFNTLMYRYPINLFLYASMAYLQYSKNNKA